jgi:hypothetical protein
LSLAFWPVPRTIKYAIARVNKKIWRAQSEREAGHVTGEILQRERRERPALTTLNPCRSEAYLTGKPS